MENIMARIFVLLSMVIYLGFAFFVFPSYAHEGAQENMRIELRADSSYGKMPLFFIKNRGQVDNSVLYYLNGKRGSIYFTKEAIVYDLFSNTNVRSKERRPDSFINEEDMPRSKRLSFSLKPEGVNSALRLISKDMHSGKINYLMGNDPKMWHTDIPLYKEIVYKNLYNGIDLKIYGTKNQMEYDFIVSPGADPSKIRIACDGIDELKVSEAGDLYITTSLGSIKHIKPLIYQKIHGKRHIVDGSYRISKNKFSFDIKEYNKEYPLIIDPLTMTYSTFLGGSGFDQGESIAVDSAGNAYVTGLTLSTDFPTESFYEDTCSGDASAFVTKINQSGDSLIYSTFIGGNGTDRAWDITVDFAGSAYVTGATDSDNFPVNNAYQSQISGESDAFVTKLTPSGNDISFSTYIGGSLSDDGKSIAVDSSGNCYITGSTTSTNFPTANAYQSALKGEADAYVAKLNSAGSSLLFSTYFGGNLTDTSEGIAIDSNGNSFITGWTYSTDFPVKSSYQNKLSGKIDSFVTKLDASGKSISYSTYLGGKGGDDIAHGIEVDSQGNAYIVGETNSTDFPVKNAYQQVKSGLIDAFITKIKPAGNSLDYSTFLGGSFGDEYGYALTLDESGCVYISGSTNSRDFPVKNAFQGVAGINKNAFVTKMSPEGDSLAFSTFIGGVNNDQVAHGIAVDSYGSAYITGVTYSNDFPVTDNFQGNYGGSGDAFISKLDMREKYVWYVDGNVSSSGDGKSWSSAFKAIQDALEVKIASGGDEIWVRKGTYKLFSPIFVPLDVAIYGGFGGGETEREQRDWRNTITIIDGQDSVYHCFYIIADATIDGFTVTGGNANDSESEIFDDSGGGFFIMQSAPTIANCKIINNHGIYGGGIFSTISIPTITNCTISGNSASWVGGAILNAGDSSPVVTNSLIVGNSSVSGGGGIYNSNYCSPTITNCTIAENIDSLGAAGIYNEENSYPHIINSIIWGNAAPQFPQMYSDESSTPTVTYCDFQGGFSGQGNVNADPMFANPTQGNYHLQKASPCIDAGNNNADEIPDTDFDGNPRILDGDDDGSAIVDIGADEYVYSTADGDLAPLGNRDGMVTVGDALVALRFALGLETPTAEDNEHGDVAPLDPQGLPNPDGVINVGDALVILRIALGLVHIGY
jgi:hypothetical protein